MNVSSLESIKSLKLENQTTKAKINDLEREIKELKSLKLNLQNRLKDKEIEFKEMESKLNGKLVQSKKEFDLRIKKLNEDLNSKN